MPIRKLPIRSSQPAVIPSLILISGCSTMPAAAPALHPQKPQACLLPVPGTLQFLPAGFEAEAPADKAKTLLDLHAQDGQAYATAVTELKDCQAWVRAQP
jgi:hypothetical protein